MKMNTMKTLTTAMLLMTVATGLSAQPAGSSAGQQASQVPGENPMIRDVFTAAPAALVVGDTDCGISVTPTAAKN